MQPIAAHPRVRYRTESSCALGRAERQFMTQPV